MLDDVRFVICEPTPKINERLKMFEPITLPRANCVFFFEAATSEAANSGMEVPHATRVMLINASLTPHASAIAIALLRKKYLAHADRELLVSYDHLYRHLLLLVATKRQPHKEAEDEQQYKTVDVTDNCLSVTDEEAFNADQIKNNTTAAFVPEQYDM